MSKSVPIIDIAPLFAGGGAAQTAVDHAIGHASQTTGAFVAAGLPATLRVDDEQVAKLHTFFALSEAEKASSAIRKANPASNQLWRGYSATLKGGWAHNEIYDIGPEGAVAGPDLGGVQILAEANVWPSAEPTPGWRAAMLTQFAALHTVSLAVMASLARAVGADEAGTMARFQTGYSTLRLLNYPRKPAETAVGGQANATRIHDGVEQPLLTMEHDDSCCLSLLWQDAKGGLQVQTPSGDWLAVPKVPGAVSIHFGDAIEPLTDNLIQATPHRVLGHGDRHSMGFFFEPDLAAELSPLPGLPAATHENGEVETYASALLKVLVRRGMYLDLIDASLGGQFTPTAG